MLCAVILCGPLSAPAAEGDPAASFQFNNAPPQAVLDALAQLYGVRFVVEAQPEERLTLASQGKVDTDGMVDLLDATLRREGLTVRREGQVVRVVPITLAAARVEMIVLKHADPKEVAEVINEIFQSRDLLRETTAQNLDLVRRLMGDLDQEQLTLLSGKLKVTAMPYPQLKAVVVRAPDVMMPTIRDFIREELDAAPPSKPKPKPKPKPEPKPKPPPDKRKMYRLDYIEANYLSGAARRLEGISTHVEPRLNALFLETNKYEQFEQLEALIELLDVPDPMRQETYHIVLNNAQVRNVRDVLNQLLRSTPDLPFTERGLAELSEAERAERLDRAAETLTAAGFGADLAEDFVTGNLGIPFGDVTIIADEANNALLIRTIPRNIESILRIVRELDRPRRQVMIKAFIGEVSLDDTLETGLDFVYTPRPDSGRQQVYSMDFNVDLNRTGLTYSFFSDRIEAFLRALQANTRLDVISRPQILTLDNERARIEFGNRVPLLQTTRVTDTGATVSTVRYEDVTTRLDVTPHINEAGFVTMDILQTVDDVSPDVFAITERLAPRILVTRQAQTRLQIRDGQTVCLGGFIGDSIDETEEKVPLLGDIPIIGAAFSKTQRTRTKSELLIFITPYVLDTPAELQAMSNDIRVQSIAARQRPRPAEELTPRTGLEANPYRDGAHRGSAYSIPPRALPPTTAPAATTEPAPPQTQPAAGDGTQPATDPTTRPATQAATQPAE